MITLNEAGDDSMLELTIQETTRRERLATLLHSAQRGDRGAFGRLWEELKDQVIPIVKNRIDDPHAVEDVLQDVVFNLGERILNNPNPVGNIEAYITTTAVHASIDAWKAAGRTPVHTACDAAELGVPDTKASEASNTNELVEMVREGVKALPEQEQELIRLRYLNGHSASQIARMRSVTVRQVNNLLKKARSMLESLLADKLSAAPHMAPIISRDGSLK